MHLFSCKFNILFPFCNAEMAKLGFITFKSAKCGILNNASRIYIRYKCTIYTTCEFFKETEINN